MKAKPIAIKNGVPVDPKDWTPEDWRDLHQAIEAVKDKIRKRHLRRSKDEAKKR